MGARRPIYRAGGRCAEAVNSVTAGGRNYKGGGE
jgi:hypothetical protein